MAFTLRVRLGVAIRAGAAAGLFVAAGSASGLATCSLAQDGRGVAVVTGGSRGIGAATCKLLALEGYSVAVNYRSDRKAADAVVAQIEAAGGTAASIKADVADPADAARLFDEAEAKLGTPLVALVNNAGITTNPERGPSTTLDGLAVDEFERVFRTNVVGALNCCREAARRMNPDAGHSAAIVNVSSGSAYIGNNIAYSVSKGALNSLQCSLVAPLMARGIRLNTVSPGMCVTDMTSSLRTLVDPAKSCPAGRFGEPEEIAQAIVWLLSEKASFTAGANIRVAGGKQTGFGM